MSEHSVRKWGPQIHSYLEAGETLLEVSTGMIAVGARRGETAPSGPIVGNGAATATRLGDSMPARASGALCVTDRRVLFFATGFRRIKKLWWEIPRDRVAGIEPEYMMFVMRFDDGSVFFFGGGRYHAEAIGAALGLHP